MPLERIPNHCRAPSLDISFSPVSGKAALLHFLSPAGVQPPPAWHGSGSPQFPTGFPLPADLTRLAEPWTQPVFIFLDTVMLTRVLSVSVAEAVGKRIPPRTNGVYCDAGAAAGHRFLYVCSPPPLVSSSGTHSAWSGLHCNTWSAECPGKVLQSQK